MINVDKLNLTEEEKKDLKTVAKAAIMQCGFRKKELNEALSIEKDNDNKVIIYRVEIEDLLCTTNNRTLYFSKFSSIENVLNTYLSNVFKFDIVDIGHFSHKIDDIYSEYQDRILGANRNLLGDFSISFMAYNLDNLNCSIGFTNVVNLKRTKRTISSLHFIVESFEVPCVALHDQEFNLLYVDQYDKLFEVNCDMELKPIRSRINISDRIIVRDKDLDIALAHPTTFKLRDIRSVTTSFKPIEIID